MTWRCSNGTRRQSKATTALLAVKLNGQHNDRPTHPHTHRQRAKERDEGRERDMHTLIQWSNLPDKPDTMYEQRHNGYWQATGEAGAVKKGKKNIILKRREQCQLLVNIHINYAYQNEIEKEREKVNCQLIETCAIWLKFIFRRQTKHDKCEMKLQRYGKIGNSDA